MLQVLSPGGSLILSTPNIDSPPSKASFVRDGTFMWFFDMDYEQHGHIMPVSQWLLAKCVSEAGFESLSLSSFGDPLTHIRGWWKIRLFSFLIEIVSRCDKSLNGEILIAVTRKPRTAEGSV